MFTGDVLPKPTSVSKPFSKERMAEIRAVQKLTGRKAILNHLKMREGYEPLPDSKIQNTK